ncbi:hypothetical protein [Sphingomonas sp. BAUL-RG-20F-R05-02]|uniref:hypothetical protein n=1 Tax=Sphingomonas sp. BAUL-RG-20F-R05-02 TaxID=2914830 RepID=UPI001F598BA0|nr:hypothetical protein [Sphingomonas sp. BAUL-RG-20F-R05-02]
MLIALVFAVMPTSTLESLVVDSGIAALVNAAQPPLGLTARAMLALVGGGVVSVLAWVALFVAVGTRLIILQNPRATGVAGPALRRADVHPDAPPRQPVFANRDLGTPFLEVRAEVAPIERTLPDDLDMPLAAFDPQSFTASFDAQTPEPERLMPTPRLAPAEPPLPIRLDTSDTPDRIAASLRLTPAPSQAEAPAPPAGQAEPTALPRLIRRDIGRAIDLIAASMLHAAPAPTSEDPTEEHDDMPVDLPAPVRVETGQAIGLIAASMQQTPARTPEGDSPTSVRALLDRLERSVARRDVTPDPAPTRAARQESIRDTLDTLRGLATRAG